jgi:hypothetical protein
MPANADIRNLPRRHTVQSARREPDQKRDLMLTVIFSSVLAEAVNPTPMTAAQVEQYERLAREVWTWTLAEEA